MTADSLFHAIALAGVIVVSAIAVRRRLQAAATKEPLDRRQEGLFILITVRLVGLSMWAGVIAYLINPSWMAWSSLTLPVWARWTGVAVLVAAIGLLSATLAALGKNLTDTVVTRQAATLVTRGPYRWVRHPFYVTLVLLVTSFTLIMSNWFIVVAGSVAFVLLAVRSKKEEQKLLERFGEPYRLYRERTGRFLPRWRG
jgi:protein-S-isoprenylcysteine O-methyltransferase Ste14